MMKELKNICNILDKREHEVDVFLNTNFINFHINNSCYEAEAKDFLDKWNKFLSNDENYILSKKYSDNYWEKIYKKYKIDHIYRLRDKVGEKKEHEIFENLFFLQRKEFLKILKLFLIIIEQYHIEYIKLSNPRYINDYRKNIKTYYIQRFIIVFFCILDAFFHLLENDFFNIYDHENDLLSTLKDIAYHINIWEINTRAIDKNDIEDIYFSYYYPILIDKIGNSKPITSSQTKK